MQTVHGKYANIKVFTDLFDKNAYEQIQQIANQPFVENCRVCSMPDVHAGTGCPVGTTMEIKDKICPNLVGVDIACGMSVTFIGRNKPDFSTVDELINNFIPSGLNVREKPLESVQMRNMTYLLHELKCAYVLDIDYMLRSIGTLGGGNHFIEMDSDNSGNYLLVIHSGSRNLGKQVCEYYQNQAIQSIKDSNLDFRNHVIQSLKATGRENEIEGTLKALKKNTIPEDLAYCEGQLMDDYLHDMCICEQYADLNRESMADIIVKGMNWDIQDHFVTLHNYIDLDNMILRKGAVSAQKGERLIIPMNMRDGSFICEGQGNADWNFSAPHGAGRLMSRKQAKETVTMDEFSKSMSGIYSTSVNSGTIDEAPQVYKPASEIEKDIADTVIITDKIKPVYNFKAREVERIWEKSKPQNEVLKNHIHKKKTKNKSKEICL